MELIVTVEVYPTESEAKVRRAVENLFPALEVMREERGEVMLLKGRSSAKNSLERFYTLLRSQAILDAARRVLTAGQGERSSAFELNKQAAFMGLVNFSEAAFEKLARKPKLGWIEVEIKDEDIEGLIDWLAPSTRDNFA